MLPEYDSGTSYGDIFFVVNKESVKCEFAPCETWVTGVHKIKAAQTQFYAWAVFNLQKQANNPALAHEKLLKTSKVTHIL